MLHEKEFFHFVEVGPVKVESYSYFAIVVRPKRHKRALMLETGLAKKLVIYVNEMNHYCDVPLYEALMKFLHQHGCSGATITRAVAGYGVSGKIHEEHPLRYAGDVPMRIEVVESARTINALLPGVYKMVDHGLIEVQDTEVIKHTPHKQQTPRSLPKHQRSEESAKMLHICIDGDDRWEGEPLHEAIICKLETMDITGATISRGGYGTQQGVYRSGFLAPSRDMPIMISIIDTEAKIRQALPMLDEMVCEGLIALSDVEIIRYTPTQEGWR